MQDFIVAWVDMSENDRFTNFESLAEAEDFMSSLQAGDSYIYLTIVIKKQ
jgi:hypothetical protein|tara:strand:+ start:492 stop:641 length:150 start_codon:yes stop_codon:yes gene_type:complete